MCRPDYTYEAEMAERLRNWNKGGYGMKISLIGCGKIGSDCTGPYRVEMSGPCTVNEFVECVLKQFPNEWGYIGIAKKGEIFGEPNIEYSRGEIITENRLEGLDNKTVLKAGAHGGWSRMDYLLDIGETEKTKIKVTEDGEIRYTGENYKI